MAVKAIKIKMAMVKKKSQMNIKVTTQIKVAFLLFLFECLQQLGRFRVIILKARQWIIVGSMFGESHASCSFNPHTIHGRESIFITIHFSPLVMQAHLGGI